MKLNITMNDELYARMEDYANRNYFNKSTLISVALTDYLNSKQMIMAIKDISLAMQKIASTNEIDDDTKAELEKFEYIASMFTKA